jgi:hypothetical protein
MRCGRTGREYADVSDGIWDDDEWISWDWINQQIHEQERRAEHPNADPELLELFDRLVEVAGDHKALTGNYLQVWGELGELYAEIRYGIKRHRPKAQGSDGRLGNDFVEVKTISPEKSAHKVHVKRTGHFSKLLVVRISADFEFDSRIIDRSSLTKGKGKRASVSWKSMPDNGE